jgi:hypothetical protein
MLGSLAKDMLGWLCVDVLAVPPQDTAHPLNTKHHRSIP